jgi:Flp pilus assembly protein TadG
MGKSSKSRTQGQAIIEFTLMLPIIITVLAGLTDFGLAFYLGTATQNAVREGARLAARGVVTNTVQQVVIDRIPAVSQFAISKSDVTVIGPTDSSVTCTDSSGGSVTQKTISVQASGTYKFAFLKYIGFDTMGISRTGIMRYEPNSLCH